MSLEEYRRKRVFTKTPEPAPGRAEPEGRRFFIQRHSARRLHYDLRLEMEGVLRSWALPHGPTLDPAIKRLAVLVEDHPLEYGNFEGTIPSGNYGAGQVTLWDRGTYEWLGQKSPQQQWLAGDLKIQLHGQKLMGEFALVRTKRASGKDWLLIKKKDFAVRPGWDPESDTRSILPGLPTLSSLDGALAAAMPKEISPMLATPGQDIPDGPDWLYEVKWDGIRSLCFLEKHKARIVSRSGKAIEGQYPEIADAIPDAIEAESAILDGEIVLFDANGIPDFQLLQNRIGLDPRSAQKMARSHPVSLMAFDLIYLNGYDLRRVSLLERRQLLASMLKPGHRIRYSDHFLGKGAELLEAVKQTGLEGVIAKNIHSPYESKRSSNWIKVKVANQQELVICGFIEGEREPFGSLVLGYWQDGKLIYAGNVGSGFTELSLEKIGKKLKTLVARKPVLGDVPRDMGRVTWVRPELVCLVRFNSWTRDKRLRAPVFLGLKPDSAPQDCALEGPGDLGAAPSGRVYEEQKLLKPGPNEVSLPIGSRRLKFTNLNKIFYPAEGYCKRDVINFYAAVSDLLVPHLQGRPLSLKRYPNGIEHEYFFQKEAAASFPDWLHTELIASDEKSSTRFVICDDRASLLYLANLGCIDQNPWMSRIGSLEHPDFVLLDLDPYHCGYDRIVEGARLVKEKLDQIGLTGYPKTTGGDGMHIYVPVKPQYTYAQVRSFAEILARWVASERPDLFTTPRTVAAREKGKVYFDYLQIATGKTISAPYVLRAYPGAPVATPLAWNEVQPGLKPVQFHIGNAARRFERTGDLFAGVLTRQQELEPALEKLQAVMTQ